MPDRPRIRSATAIAKRLGVSRSTVYGWWKDHGLPAFKVAGSTSPLVVYTDELDRWLAEKRSAPIGRDG